MITFVTFHVLPREVTVSDDVLMATSESNINYQTIINLMFLSASLFNDKPLKVVLSDLHTELSQLLPEAIVRRYVIDSRDVMLSRLATQIQFLKETNEESSIVMLDSDILLNGNLDFLLEQDFDIGLTVRNPAPIHEGISMPINGGIFFIPAYRKTAATQFLEKVYAVYQEHYSHTAQWWGDQFALAQVVEQSSVSSFEPGIIDVNGVKVCLLDCDKFNFSPDFETDLDLTIFENSLILHFKGLRKQFMQTYWDYFLNPDRQILTIEDAYEEQKTRIDLLQRNRFEMKQKIRGLEKKYKKLEIHAKELEAYNASLRAYGNELKSQNAELKSQLYSLRWHPLQLLKYFKDYLFKKFYSSQK